MESNYLYHRIEVLEDLLEIRLHQALDCLLVIFVFVSQKSVFVLANSVDPDEMLLSVGLASHLGLYNLLKC